MPDASERPGAAAAAAQGTCLSGATVVVVIPTLGRGGAERQAMLLARYLTQQAGAHVHLISVAHDDVSTTLVPELDAAALPFERFTLGVGRFQKIEQIRDVVRFGARLRQLRPDVVLPYTMLPNVLCGLTWRMSGARTCIWNQRDEGRSRVARWVERQAVRQTPHFLSNSSHGARFLIDTLGVAAGLVDVIHNGIELARPVRDRQAWRASLGAAPDVVVTTMVANLHRFKDHDTLVAAWRRVQDALPPAGPRALLTLAGAPGDQAEAIRRQITALGLDDHVRLLGPVTDVAGLLGASDLLVFSSHNEGLPNAVLEGMAAGLPVVATDYPGIREVVGPAGGPWLAAPRDPADLAERLLQVIASPDIRQVAGQQGRQRVTSSFSVDGMGAATAAVICRLLAPPPQVGL